MSTSNGPRTLLLDIETAPALAYIWDLKTRYVPLSQVAEDGHVLCWAGAWLGEDDIHFYSKWDDGEEAMVEAVWDMLDEADAVITYNGQGFDIPRLNTEFLRMRLGPPSPSHQIDLYRVVNSKFRVLSKSLKHMLNVLGLENKLDHKGMDLWTGCMHGKKEDQKIMSAYNLKDVEVLEELYKELLPWMDNHPNIALWMEPGEDPICPNCGSQDLRFKGYKRTRVLSYKQYQCNDCGFYPRERFAEEVGTARRKDVLR